MRSKTIKKQSKPPNSGNSDSLLFVREIRTLLSLLEKKSVPCGSPLSSSQLTILKQQWLPEAKTWDLKTNFITQT